MAQRFPHGLMPLFCSWYANDIFVLFLSLDHAEKLKTHLSSKHPNINFLLKKENDGRLSLLDINIFVKKDNLSLVFIGKRPSVLFILNPTTSY